MSLLEPGDVAVTSGGNHVVVLERHPTHSDHVLAVYVMMACRAVDYGSKVRPHASWWPEKSLSPA